MKLFNFLAVSILSLGVAGCSEFSGHNDVISKTYGTYSEASNNEAFELGWLPRQMPLSARNIIEVHSVDSGELWLRFEYKDEDIVGLLEGCAARPTPHFPDRRRTLRSAPWWPDYLVREYEGRVSAGLSVFSCPKMSHASSEYAAGIAVSRSTRTVWYWIAK